MKTPAYSVLSGGTGVMMCVPPAVRAAPLPEQNPVFNPFGPVNQKSYEPTERDEPKVSSLPQRQAPQELKGPGLRAGGAHLPTCVGSQGACHDFRQAPTSQGAMPHGLRVGSAARFIILEQKRDTPSQPSFHTLERLKSSSSSFTEP